MTPNDTNTDESDLPEPFTTRDDLDETPLHRPPRGLSYAAEQATQEWAIHHGRNYVTGEETSAAVPCQLRFVEAPEANVSAVDRFHSALRPRGWTPLDPDRSRRAVTKEGLVYRGEIANDENHARVKVRANAVSGSVRLYPHDDYIPTIEQLISLIDSLDIGFDAPLVHDPIDQQSTRYAGEVTDRPTDEPRLITFDVTFSVEEDDQPITERVTVERESDENASPAMRAIDTASEQVDFTMIETLAIDEVDD